MKERMGSHAMNQPPEKGTPYIYILYIFYVSTHQEKHMSEKDGNTPKIIKESHPGPGTKNSCFMSCFVIIH
jgi:hypothetical protein